MAGFRDWWASRPRARVTGVSTPFVGMAWELEPSCRLVLEQLVTYLDNRRVLVAFFRTESSGYVLESVLDIRLRIQKYREQIPADTAAHAILGKLLEACRQYLTQTEDLASQQAQPARLSPLEELALIRLRQTFLLELHRLKGIINVPFVDEFVTKVTLGYMIPAFEYEMRSALSAPGCWRPVHAFVPEENGTPYELPIVLGYVRADEELSSDGKIVTRWLAIPPKWPFAVKQQPHNWHELLFEACFDRSADAEYPQRVSENIPHNAGVVNRDLIIFKQMLLTITLPCERPDAGKPK